MAAVTGAIWKCATNNAENVERFKELELLPIVIQVIFIYKTLYAYKML
jgi:hypothetical protein